MITRFLSTKLLFWIGLISYSLYLWHFPIFAFGQIISSSKGFLNNFFLVGITVILSILTYYLIEQPVKKNKSKTSFYFNYISNNLYCFLLLVLSKIKDILINLHI